MTTNIHYLIAGMAVLLVVIWQYSRQRQMDDRNSRMFRRLLSVVSLDVAAELVSTGFILYAPYSFNICRMLSNTVFYLFQALLLLLYYVCTLCTSRVIAPATVLRMGIPTIALVCIILTNPFTEMLFYFDGTGYRHGPWYLLLYVSALLHIAGAAVFVTVHRASVSRRNLASLFAVFALAALGIAAQAVNPSVLTTGFGLSLSILAMYLTINNPCACMDSLTGLNDKQYLLRRMDELTDAHKAFHIITVYAYQLDHMNKIAGMRGGDEFLRRAAERMQEIAGRNVFRVTGRRFLLLTFSLREYETCLTRLRELFHTQPDDAQSAPTPVILCGVVNAEKLGTSGLVLDMSRIESGKVSLEPRPVHLPELVHDLRDIIQSGISAKRISLFIDMVDVEDEDVIADPMRLNQIMLNIMSNAIKFTPAGGTITLRIVQKQTAPKGCADYEFHIRDNGIGMSPAFQEHIFEQFAREETSTVSGIQGTGLGMAITKNLVDMMDGGISVESEPGKGSEFTVSLRFPVSGERAAAPARIPQLEGLRALVADDDTDTCLNVSKMLRTIGMRADWTTSGREAVVRAQDALDQGDGFRVFIIDWMIPDMNGLEVVRRVRRLIGDATPIIILTAYDWTDIEVEARDAGVTAFCAKPLFLSELRRVLAEPFRMEEQKESTENAAEFAGKRLLVVEDNALNREIAVTMLEEAGFAVDTAENGKLAVDKVRESAPGYYDLVLMDIQMPVMNGYEATRAIRALPDAEKAALPIVAITANAFDEDRQNAAKAGMNGHLSKPFDMQQLLAMIEEVL